MSRQASTIMPGSWRSSNPIHEDAAKTTLFFRASSTSGDTLLQRRPFFSWLRPKIRSLSNWAHLANKGTAISRIGIGPSKSRSGGRSALEWDPSQLTRIGRHKRVHEDLSVWNAGIPRFPQRVLWRIRDLSSLCINRPLFATIAEALPPVVVFRSVRSGNGASRMRISFVPLILNDRNKSC
jgi:hypothetical protein